MNLGRWISGLAFVAVTLSPAAPLPAQADPVLGARQQFDAGHYKEAIQLLESAIAKNPTDAALYFWLGRSYYELDDFNRALPAAERSVVLAPGNSEYYDWLGRTFGGKAESAGWFSGFSLARKSKHEFETAVRLDPRNTQAQRDLITYYFSAPGIVGGGDDKALRQIEQLQTIDPIQADLARGDYWAEKKQFVQAEAEYRKALEARPKTIGPYFEVAEFYEDREQPGPMAEAVEAAARVDPADPRLNYYRGAVRVLERRELDEAASMLQRYLASVPRRSDYPSHASAHAWLGRLYEIQGKPAEAANHYRAALQLRPRDKKLRDALKRVERQS